MNHAEENETEYTDSDEEEINEAAFVGILPAFKMLVQTTKQQLYQSIIKGPPITSKKAQKNTLLLEYLQKSNHLYQLFEILHKLSAPEVEHKLSVFPIQTRHSIKQLLEWLRVFSSKNKYVDTIPYYDYLDVQLKRYPCLQKII
jgi:hypothetical protein